MGEGAPPRGAPALTEVVLRGLCPRCGAPGLFHGIIGFAPKYRMCGLDFQGFNVGDGPIALITLVFGAVVTIAAVVFELAVSPPWWVHVILWLPLTAIGVLALLRVTKAVLLALEYRNAAREGRIAPPDA